MQTQNCPNCDHNLNPEIGIEGEPREPLPNDLAVCVRCSALLKFDEALKLALCSNDEIEAIALQNPTDYRRITTAQNRVAVGNGQPYPPSL
jgi:hypothetical protein